MIFGLTIIEIFDYFSNMVLLASLICAVTPTPHPDTKLGKIYKFVEITALNVYKAKEKGK
jgi:hypothetical protein